MSEPQTAARNVEVSGDEALGRRSSWITNVIHLMTIRRTLLRIEEDVMDGFPLVLKNRHTGEILRLRRIHGAQGRIIIAFDVSLPPGTSGPLPHIHFQENEEFRVKAGTLGVRIGGKEIVVPAGGSATIPAGTVHTWWNTGNDMLEFDGQFSGQLIPEADFDRFAQAVFAVANAGPPDRPPIFHIAHVAWRHRHTQAGAMPPPAIQRIVFPVILLIGWILGKYRGDRWPGSPASCPGALEVNVANAHPLR